MAAPHPDWTPVTASEVRAGAWRDIGVDGDDWALAQAAERAVPGDLDGQRRWMVRHALDFGAGHAR